MKDVVTITRDKYRELVSEICGDYLKTNTKDPMFEALMMMQNMAVFMALENKLFNTKEEN